MFDAALVEDDIAAEALAGLTAPVKTLPPKLFYDAEGVRLFEAITRLPEYYLTRAERQVLTRAAPEIVALAEPGSALVEYGASDEAKARLLLDSPARAFAADGPIAGIPGWPWRLSAAIFCGRSPCLRRSRTFPNSASSPARRSAISIPAWQARSWPVSVGRSGPGAG